jgi:serine/threonine protein kinase
MYVLLTGLNPFYNVETTKEVISLIFQQQKAYIDPRWKERSPAEAKLAEIIPKCFEYEPKNRISIFEVVDYLKHAVNELLHDGMTRESVLQGIKPK